MKIPIGTRYDRNAQGLQKPLMINLLKSFVFIFSVLFFNQFVFADANSDIQNKYQSLGGSSGFLGNATTPVKVAPDGKGRYRHFQGGSIYWHPSTGAHEIHGAILSKWRSMGWEKSILGYPSTDERVTPDGVGRYNHFRGAVAPSNGNVIGQRGSIYWTPAHGAHWVHGPIRDRWALDGWEKGPLGYPTSDMAFRGDRYISNNFENGRIDYSAGQGLSVFTQNMGFLVAPAEYGGENLSRAFWALKRELEILKPDVVALQEMFRNDRRAQLRDELSHLYPYWQWGPDESDLESDGGLMILSKYPLISTDSIVFRDCSAEDCFANKGIIHARINAPFGVYDVFNVHTQNPYPDLTSSAIDELYGQINVIKAFVDSKRENKQYPAIIMGDFNVNGRNNSDYQQLISRLGNPIDAWKEKHGSDRGITYDYNNNFEPGESRPRDSDRGKSGERLDYVFYFPGARYQPKLEQTEIMIWETDTGKDMSDHYGIYSWFSETEEADPVYTGPISKVEVKFYGFHCFTVTDGTVPLSDPDEVEWNFEVLVDDSVNHYMKTGRFNDIDGGEYFSVGNAKHTTGRVNNNIKIFLEGQEVDDICFPWGCSQTGRVSLGRWPFRLSKSQLYEAMVSPQRYTIGIMRGDGSEYAGYIEVRAFQ